MYSANELCNDAYIHMYGTVLRPHFMLDNDTYAHVASTDRQRMDVDISACTSCSPHPCLVLLSPANSLDMPYLVAQQVVLDALQVPNTESVSC